MGSLTTSKRLFDKTTLFLRVVNKKYKLKTALFLKTESRIPVLAYNRCFGYLFISAFCFAYLYNSPGERTSIVLLFFLRLYGPFSAAFWGFRGPWSHSIPLSYCCSWSCCCSFEPSQPFEPLLLSLSAFSFLWSFCCPLVFHRPWRHPLFRSSSLSWRHCWR